MVPHGTTARRSEHATRGNHQLLQRDTHAMFWRRCPREARRLWRLSRGDCCSCGLLKPEALGRQAKQAPHQPEQATVLQPMTGAEPKLYRTRWRGRPAHWELGWTMARAALRGYRVRFTERPEPTCVLPVICQFLKEDKQSCKQSRTHFVSSEMVNCLS